MNTRDIMRQAGRSGSGGPLGFSATVVNTAAALHDELFVVLDSDPAPKSKIEVMWRLNIDDSGDPVYPQEGDRGVIIIADGGMPWLIW